MCLNATLGAKRVEILVPLGLVHSDRASLTRSDEGAMAGRRHGVFLPHSLLRSARVALIRDPGVSELTDNQEMHRFLGLPLIA